MAAEITDELHGLEMRLEQINGISLLDVEVTQNMYGKGVIIAQQDNRITVKFEAGEKMFIISKKYPVCPKFENDTETVEAFTEYESLLQKIDALKRKIAQM